MKSERPLTVFVLPLLIACGSGGGAKSANDVKCPEGQTFDGEYCQVDQTVATAAQAVAPQEPAEGDAPGDPEEVQPSETDEYENAVTPGDGEADPEDEGPSDEPQAAEERKQATPVDVTMAAQAGPLIQYMAGAHLPAGARQFGAPFAGQFAEGQILERKVQLTQGKCYTFMAAGLPPISEVDLELYVDGGDDAVAKDATVGLQAVIGSRTECYQPQETGPHKLVLSVSKGQGIAAAQVFQK